jgi:FkbM family methyltransferase
MNISGDSWKAIFSSTDNEVLKQLASIMIKPILKKSGDNGKLCCMINGRELIISTGFINMFMHCFEPGIEYPLRFFIETRQADWLSNQLKAGDTAVDVGASGGMITACMSESVGTQGDIYSFEPANKAYSFLRQIVADNKLDNVLAVKKAISDQDGILEFGEYSQPTENSDKPAWLPEASALLNPLINKETAHIYYVETTTLDNYFQRIDKHIKAIKIDIEGFELHALQGASAILEKHRPSLCIDIHADPSGNGQSTRSRDIPV